MMIWETRNREISDWFEQPWCSVTSTFTVNGYLHVRRYCFRLFKTDDYLEPALSSLAHPSYPVSSKGLCLLRIKRTIRLEKPEAVPSYVKIIIHGEWWRGKRCSSSLWHPDGYWSVEDQSSIIMRQMISRGTSQLAKKSSQAAFTIFHFSLCHILLITTVAKI